MAHHDISLCNDPYAMGGLADIGRPSHRAGCLRQGPAEDERSEAW